MKRALQIGVNIVLLCSSVAALWTVAKSRLVKDTVQRLRPTRIEPGRVLSSFGYWGANGRTLVIAVSPGCQPCITSVPFYRTLVTASRESRGVRMMGVVPRLQGARKLFIDNKIDVDDVLQTDLTHVGIEITPSLLLVDSQGRVERSWQGPLNRAQESELLGLVRSARPLPDVEVAAEELSALVHSRQVTLVDVRARMDYGRMHLRGAMNIPTDELEVRAPDEIPIDPDVVVYCGCRRGGESRIAQILLHGLGYKVRYLAASMEDCRRAGIGTEGDPVKLGSVSHVRSADSKNAPHAPNGPHRYAP